MSEEKEEYQGLGHGPGLSSSRSPLRGPEKNESIITWHKPEDKPEAGQEVIVLVQDDPDNPPWWTRGIWYPIGHELSVPWGKYPIEGWHYSLYSRPIRFGILAWGVFEMPDILEVTNANFKRE